MAWTTPRTWVAGETVTAALMNTHVRDNLSAALPTGESGTDVAFSAGNFTASGSMTWTLTSGDQTTFRYIRVGKTLTIWLYLTGTSVGGTASSELRVTVPGGYTVGSATARGTFYGTDNGTDVSSFWEATASGTLIKFYRNASAGNWSNVSTNNTAIFAVLTFEVA